MREGVYRATLRERRGTRVLWERNGVQGYCGGRAGYTGVVRGREGVHWGTVGEGQGTLGYCGGGVGTLGYSGGGSGYTGVLWGRCGVHWGPEAGQGRASAVERPESGWRPHRFWKARGGGAEPWELPLRHAPPRRFRFRPPRACALASGRQRAPEVSAGLAVRAPLKASPRRATPHSLPPAGLRGADRRLGSSPPRPPEPRPPGFPRARVPAARARGRAGARRTAGQGGSRGRREEPHSKRGRPGGVLPRFISVASAP